MESDFVFGYGSIINNSSRRSTLQHISVDDEAILATLSPKFGYKRSWCFRSSTGFTALGMQQIDIENDACLGICGVLFPIPNSESLTAFDLREVGYYRMAVPNHLITLSSNKNCPVIGKVWIYIPEANRLSDPDENFPILQTYVDICIRGCHDWGGISLVSDFLISTSGWNDFFLNDTIMSRRPWLHRPDYLLIDKCLEDHGSHTKFIERRHPEEFASHHLTSLRGLWGVPPRNEAFTGREEQLASLHEKLVFERSLDQSCGIKICELSGIGGVGKTQLSIEYCHRHFGSTYGLVVMIRAESRFSIAAEFRRLALDLGLLKAVVTEKVNDKSLSGNVSVKEVLTDDIDDDEVVEIIRRKLARCRFRWLFVFDNVEDPSVIATYLPRGQLLGQLSSQFGGDVHPNGNSGACTSEEQINCQGGGHVIVTSRTTKESSTERRSFSSSVLLECFEKNESLRFLDLSIHQSTGEASISLSQADESKSLVILADRMGHLPLALAMASAYLIRCDVSATEYLTRLDKLIMYESEGETLGASDYSVVSSLSISLDRIAGESESAYAVLLLLGFMSPDGITKKLVQLLLEIAYFKNKSFNKIYQESINKEIPRIISKEIMITMICTLTITTAVVLLPLVRLKSLLSRIKIGSVVLSCFAGFGMCSMVDIVCKKMNINHTNYYDYKSDEVKSNIDLRTGLVSRTDSTGSTGLSRLISEESLLRETDHVWELLKQFSLLSVRGARNCRVGSIHRLQQAVLRSRNFSIGGEIAVRDKLEQCIGAVDEMWNFKSDNPSTWEECGTVLFHVQAIVDHVQKYSVQLHIARRFSVILTEAALYSTQVLSRFDFAQTLLENASIIQDKVQNIGNIGPPGNSMDPLELLEERSNTLHTLGKVLRIRGDFYKGEKMLQSALEMRGLSKSTKICDTLHELGVLNMKIHEYPIALVYLTDSLALKQDLSPKLKQLVDTSEAATLHQLAVIFTAESNYDEAERLLLLALELESEDDTCEEKSIREVKDHKRTIDRPKLKNSVSRAATVQQLGRVALRQGKLVEADLRFNDALRLYLGAYGKEKASRHINVAAVYHQLGNCLSAMHNFPAAIEHFSAALATRELIYGEDGNGNIEVIQEIQALGQAELEIGRLETAEMHFSRQFDMCARMLNYDTKDMIVIENTSSLQTNLEDDIQSSLAMRKQDSVVKSLLFSVYSLRSIAKKRNDSTRAAEFGRRVRDICRTYKKSGGCNDSKSDSVSTSVVVESKHDHIECRAEEDVKSNALFLPKLLQVRVEVRNAARMLFSRGRKSGSENDLLKLACSGVQDLEIFLHNCLHNIRDDNIGLEVQRDQIALRVGLEFAQSVSRNILDSNINLMNASNDLSDSVKCLATDLFLKCDTLRSSLRNLGLKIEDI